MFKVNNKNTKTTPSPVALFWYLVIFKHIWHIAPAFLLISEGQELISSLKFAKDFLMISGCIKLKNWAEMD